MEIRATSVAVAGPRRPKFDQFLLERRIQNAEAAKALSVSREAIRRYRLPFGHPARIIPGEPILTRIVSYTAGEITAADFYPPHLTGEVGLAVPHPGAA